MKEQLTGNRFGARFAMLLVMAACSSLAQAQVVVNLSVSPSEDRLVISTPGSCSRANTPGCIRANGRTMINFNLTGSNRCARGSGATWQLAQVVLGGKNSSSKPSGWGGLDADVSSDFNADRTTGVVSPQSSSANHILIMDRNAHQYDIWYKVVANCVVGDEVFAIESDPRIENDGGGN